MAFSRSSAGTSSMVTVLNARANLGNLLDRAESEQRSIVIEKRGAPRAVLLSIRDYVRLAAPEPEILRLIGQEAERNGTDQLSPQEIDRIVHLTRRARKKS